MIKYRDHRCSLIESMKTETKFETIEKLKEHINKQYKMFGQEVEEIKFKYVGYDNRINWDTYYVLHRLKGNK